MNWSRKLSLLGQVVVLLLSSLPAFFSPGAVHAGEGFWETHGPYGGWMWRAEYDPGTMDLCYAAGNNGVFRSEDGGITWRRSVPDLPASLGYVTCYSFCASKALPGLLFADMGYYERYSLFKSEDGGLTWEGLDTPWSDDYVTGIACDPRNADHVCASVYAYYPSGVIYQSLDRGRTWRSIYNGAAPDCVCIDPSDSDVIWTSSYDEGPTRTRDGGETWERAIAGLPSFSFADSIYVSFANSNDVFMCDYYLYHWSEEWESWDDCGIQANDIAYYAGDPSLMYGCGYHNFYSSEDGGLSWDATVGGQGSLFLDVSPHDPNEVIIAEMSGIWRSTDGCRDVVQSYEGVCGRYIYNLVLCGLDEDVFLCSGPGTLARCVGGSKWENNTTFVGSHVSRFDDDNPLVQDPFDPATLYACINDKEMIFRSEDAGENWERISFAPNREPIDGIAIDPSNSERIYLAGGDNWIYRSINGGSDWERLGVPTGVGDYDYTTAVAVDPSAPRRIFVCSRTSGLYRSTDDGESFERVPGLRISPTFVYFDLSKSRVVYAGDSDRGGLFRSEDSGETWNQLDTPVNSIFAMAINPTNSTDFYISGYQGVHHTRDGGKTWTSLSTQGLQCASTTAIIVDFGEAGNTIHAAGAAVFSYFDPHTPIITLRTSDSKYRVGETLRLTLDLSNPGDGFFADLAVAIALPDGTLIYLPSLWIAYSPFHSGWIPGQLTLTDYTLLEAPVDAGLPSGMYCAYAALFEQGTMTYLSNLAACQFRITASRK